MCTLCSRWNDSLEAARPKEPPTCQQAHVLEGTKNMRICILTVISYYSSCNLWNQQNSCVNMKKIYWHTLESVLSSCGHKRTLPAQYNHHSWCMFLLTRNYSGMPEKNFTDSWHANQLRWRNLFPICSVVFFLYAPSNIYYYYYYLFYLFNNVTFSGTNKCTKRFWFFFFFLQHLSWSIMIVRFKVT